jgi:hypothetical protein
MYGKFISSFSEEGTDLVRLTFLNIITDIRNGYVILILECDIACHNITSSFLGVFERDVFQYSDLAASLGV